MASQTIEVDVAVIGGGTAGLVARKAAIAAGARTVLINAGPWGTTCVRVGCMPSKLLLSAARAAAEARRAGTFGIALGAVRVDGRAVMDRVRAGRDYFLRNILDAVEAIPAREKIAGRARFVGPTTLVVDDQARVEARAVVIATGSHSVVPRLFDPVAACVLTCETVFDLRELPSSVAVIGAGPLGIELATAFTRLGVRTTVFDEGEAIGGLKDAAVARAARALLGEELDLQLGVTLAAAARPGGALLSWTRAGGDGGEAVFERVLVATGRPPNLRDLGLEAAGLDCDRHGVPRHDRATQRCGTSDVFIAGDASNDLPVLHEAQRQGEVAGRNAALRGVSGFPPPAALAIVFTDPDMATIGQSLAALGDDAAVGCCDFKAGRGRIEDRRGGMIRLYARRRDGSVAGGEMVGPGVEHLAHLVAFMVQARMEVTAALRLPMYHPTYEEDLKDCLRDLERALGRAEK